jgi:hypothetical protein
VLVVGATLVVARSRPPRHPMAQFRFAPCDDRACFMGIKPGETSFVEAKQILLANNGREISPTDIAIDVEAYEVHVLSFNASPNVTTVDVRLNLQPGTVMNMNQFADLTAFLEEFGTPCAISHVSSSPYVELIYPFMYLYTILQDERIPMDLKSSALSSTFTISAPNPAVCRYQGLSPIVPWRGFASLVFYRVHGLQDQ